MTLIIVTGAYDFGAISKNMKTRSGVAIAYCKFADVRLNFTALVNTAAP
jgi:hypothetical protein